MKLLSYHIENYGKIHDQDGDFSDGLTCICAQNGFGKSTMASFLKAMFYGLASYTAATKAFTDRQRYYPFTGGKFGGNLTFEYDGAVYRIERFFDKKSAKGDECKVYKNGALYDGFGEEIGKSIFGVDEESFQKTAFITADEVEISSTHSINEKLNGTVDGTDEHGFERAMEILDRAKKNLKAARGSGGKINELKGELLAGNAQLKNLQDMSQSLALEYTKRERLSAEIRELDEKLKRTNGENLLLQKWETYDRTLAQKQDKERALLAWNAKYPLGLPTAQERATLQERWQQNNLIRGKLQGVEFSSDKAETLRSLEEKFQNDVPRVELTDEIQAKISRLTVLETERKNLENRRLTAREEELERRFANRLPTEEELQTKRALAEEIQGRKKQLQACSTELLQRQAQPPERKFNLKTCLLVLAIVLFGVGMGAWFFIQAVAIGLWIAGGVCLLAGLLLKSVNATMSPSNGENELLSMQSEIQRLEGELLAFTRGYEPQSEDGTSALVRLEEDVKAYRAQKQAEMARLAQLKEICDQATGLRAECTRFLARYGVQTESLQSGLNQLTAEVTSYRTLQSDKANTEQSKRDFTAQLQAGEAALLATLRQYGLEESVGTMDGLKGLEMAVKTKETLMRDIENLTRDLDKYQAENGLTERPTGEKVSVDELHARLSELRRELANCDKRIAETERQVERQSDLENALALNEEKLEEYKEKYDLLVDTMSALTDAEQALKDKYVAPIKTRFFVYAEALEKVLGEKVRMDKDFKIVFERGGETRSDRHLSAGERTLCALCLRLALIDNMYESEQPFIIMDDPFVHLDETHMARTKELLHLLAEQKQILYFCCHESRKI